MFHPRLTELAPPTNIDQLVGRMYARIWDGQKGPHKFGLMELTARAEEAADVLARPDDFPKEWGLLSNLGRSRLDTGGEEWAARRDLTQPSYRRAAKSDNHPKIASAYEEEIAKIPPGAGMHLEKALLTAGARVFTKALGGSSDGTAIADWILSVRDVAIITQSAAMFGVTDAQYQELQKDIERMNVATRKLVSSDPGLDSAVRRMEAHVPFEGFEGESEFLINAFAATETTVSSILWVFSMLAKFPDIQQRIYEAAEAEGPKARDIELLVQETQRFFPPVPILVRKVSRAPIMIADRQREDTRDIGLSIVGLHHNVDYWTEPRRFNIDRPEFVEGTYHRRAFLPFSAGPRVCGGLGMARQEAHSAVAAVVRRFKILPDDRPRRLQYALTMRPRFTEELVLEERVA